MIYLLAFCYLVTSGLMSKSLINSFHPRLTAIEQLCIFLGVLIVLVLDVYLIGLGIGVLLN